MSRVKFILVDSFFCFLKVTWMRIQGSKHAHFSHNGIKCVQHSMNCTVAFVTSYLFIYSFFFICSVNIIYDPFFLFLVCIPNFACFYAYIYFLNQLWHKLSLNVIKEKKTNFEVLIFKFWWFWPFIYYIYQPKTKNRVLNHDTSDSTVLNLFQWLLICE